MSRSATYVWLSGYFVAAALASAQNFDHFLSDSLNAAASMMSVFEIRRVAVWAAILIAGASAPAYAQRAETDFDGYTEPNQTIRVSADESGLIFKVLVREGETVTAGQPLVQLDTSLLDASIAVARHAAESRGELQAAEAQLALHEDRLQKIAALRRDGHARQEELDRAHADVAVAGANVLTAKEELERRRLELAKLAEQARRRTVVAPIDGVIVEIEKRKGEFVSPNSPGLLSLVELNPLIANFNLNSDVASQLRQGDPMQIRFLASKEEVSGTIQLISPVTNAESGTVHVQVRIENEDGKLRSGERCVATPATP